MAVLMILAPYRITRLRLLISAAFLILFIGQCQSQFRPPQVDITPADTVGYSFIQQEANEIQNIAHLNPFFSKLYEQRVQGGQKINIVQIGDSHILGNFLTREVRERLQRALAMPAAASFFPTNWQAPMARKTFWQNRIAAGVVPVASATLMYPPRLAFPVL